MRMQNESSTCCEVLRLSIRQDDLRMRIGTTWVEGAIAILPMI